MNYRKGRNIDVVSWKTPWDATVFRPNCPQNYEFGVFAGPPSDHEDCLYLNVFLRMASAADAPQPSPLTKL